MNLIIMIITKFQATRHAKLKIMLNGLISMRIFNQYIIYNTYAIYMQLSLFLSQLNMNYLLCLLFSSFYNVRSSTDGHVRRRSDRRIISGFEQTAHGENNGSIINLPKSAKGRFSIGGYKYIV